VVARLARAGLGVLVLELAQPLVVRRKVAFAEAVFAGETQVEELRGVLCRDLEFAETTCANGDVAVLVDAMGESIRQLMPTVLVDARMMKAKPEWGKGAAALVIGLGPGFTAGEDCHAVVETMRGHNMGRVFWEGRALADTGVPEAVMSKQGERVLRAPVDGIMADGIEIGKQVQAGERLARIGETWIEAPFEGVVRGLVADGVAVSAGMKIGDLDPRNDPSLAFRISDKALAVGGGVLEVVLSRAEIRERLWR
jgi:xanthine dehydrogenase accessory factor